MQNGVRVKKEDLGYQGNHLFVSHNVDICLFHLLLSKFNHRSNNVVAGGLSCMLAVVALLAGSFGILGCRTMEIPSLQTDASISIGAWSYRTQNYAVVGNEIWVIDTCRSYKFLDKDLGVPFDLDTKSKAVMAFSILATMFGSLAVMLSCFATCGGGVSASTWKVTGTLLLFSGFL